MTDKTEADKQALPKGTGAMRVALLLFVVAIVLTLGGASGLAGFFVLGTLVCAVIGGVQRMSARR